MTCSPSTRNLARVQRLLGSRVGKDVRMITISVDPRNDTPAALKRFAGKFGASRGWYFLTGDPEQVTAVLKRFGAYTEKPEEHPNPLFIGDDATGYWTKTHALERPETIAHAVRGIDAK